MVDNEKMIPLNSTQILTDNQHDETSPISQKLTQPLLSSTFNLPPPLEPSFLLPPGVPMSSLQSSPLTFKVNPSSIPPSVLPTQFQTMATAPNIDHLFSNNNSIAENVGCNNHSTAELTPYSSPPPSLPPTQTQTMATTPNINHLPLPSPLVVSTQRKNNSSEISVTKNKSWSSEKSGKSITKPPSSPFMIASPLASPLVASTPSKNQTNTGGEGSETKTVDQFNLLPHSWQNVPPKENEPDIKVVKDQHFRWSTRNHTWIQASDKWFKLPPNENEPDMKIVKGNQFSWCIHHQKWTKHKSEVCTLRNTNKDKDPERKKKNAKEQENIPMKPLFPLSTQPLQLPSPLVVSTSILNKTNIDEISTMRNNFCSAEKQGISSKNTVYSPAKPPPPFISPLLVSTPGENQTNTGEILAIRKDFCSIEKREKTLSYIVVNLELPQIADTHERNNGENVDVFNRQNQHTYDEKCESNNNATKHTENSKISKTKKHWRSVCRRWGMKVVRELTYIQDLLCEDDDNNSCDGRSGVKEQRDGTFSGHKNAVSLTKPLDESSKAEYGEQHQHQHQQNKYGNNPPTISVDGSHGTATQIKDQLVISQIYESDINGSVNEGNNCENYRSPAIDADLMSGDVIHAICGMTDVSLDFLFGIMRDCSSFKMTIKRMENESERKSRYGDLFDDKSSINCSETSSICQKIIVNDNNDKPMNELIDKTNNESFVENYVLPLDETVSSPVTIGKTNNKSLGTPSIHATVSSCKSPDLTTEKMRDEVRQQELNKQPIENLMCNRNESESEEGCFSEDFSTASRMLPTCNEITNRDTNLLEDSNELEKNTITTSLTTLSDDGNIDLPQEGSSQGTTLPVRLTLDDIISSMALLPSSDISDSGKLLSSSLTSSSKLHTRIFNVLYDARKKIERNLGFPKECRKTDRKVTKKKQYSHVHHVPTELVDDLRILLNRVRRDSVVISNRGNSDISGTTGDINDNGKRGGRGSARKSQIQNMKTILEETLERTPISAHEQLDYESVCSPSTSLIDSNKKHCSFPLPSIKKHLNWSNLKFSQLFPQLLLPHGLTHGRDAFTFYQGEFRIEKESIAPIIDYMLKPDVPFFRSFNKLIEANKDEIKMLDIIEKGVKKSSETCNLDIATSEDELFSASASTMESQSSCSSQETNGAMTSKQKHANCALQKPIPALDMSRNDIKSGVKDSLCQSYDIIELDDDEETTPKQSNTQVVRAIPAATLKLSSNSFGMKITSTSSKAGLSQLRNTKLKRLWPDSSVFSKRIMKWIPPKAATSGDGTVRFVGSIQSNNNGTVLPPLPTVFRDTPEIMKLFSPHILEEGILSANQDFLCNSDEKGFWTRKACKLSLRSCTPVDSRSAPSVSSSVRTYEFGFNIDKKCNINPPCGLGELYVLYSPSWKVSSCCLGLIGSNGINSIYLQDQKVDDSADFKIWICVSESRFENTGWLSNTELPRRCSDGSVEMQTMYALNIATVTDMMRQYEGLKSLLCVKKHLQRAVFTTTDSKTEELDNKFNNHQTIPLLTKPSSIPVKVWDHLVSALNPFQVSTIEKIMSGKTKENISLLQGPPGTGKTAVCIALVSALLNGTCPQSGAKTSGTRVQVGHSISNKSKDNAILDEPVAHRILVCASSNQAVDDLAWKLHNEALGPNGMVGSFNIVRFGMQPGEERHDGRGKGRGKVSTGCLSPQDKFLRSISLDNLVENVTKGYAKNEFGSNNDSLSTINNYNTERANILSQCHVVCCTLSGSGSKAFTQSVSRDEFPQSEFEALIIDEACQAQEALSLIPFKYNPNCIFLVGDPQQLPVFTLSKNAQSSRVDRSLFERLTENGWPINLLRVQYRMNDEIAQFPIKQFYNGQLFTDNTVKTRRAPIWYKHRCFPPYLIWNLKNGHMMRTNNSFSNSAEINFILKILKEFSFFYGCEREIKIGIIAFYNDQVTRIKEKLQKSQLNLWLKSANVSIEVSTVDGFQGCEKDIILLSCVRSNLHQAKKKTNNDVGFLQDYRRVNVALTRARHSLWIISDCETLSNNPLWKSIFDDAQKRELIVMSKYFDDMALRERAPPNPSNKRKQDIDKNNKFKRCKNLNKKRKKCKIFGKK